MTQGRKENHYIAESGKVFQRINNGFGQLSTPVILGPELILGTIIIDKDGRLLSTPIEDKIEYYEEIDAPAVDENGDVKDAEYANQIEAEAVVEDQLTDTEE